jgi:hypothetical protein
MLRDALYIQIGSNYRDCDEPLDFTFNGGAIKYAQIHAFSIDCDILQNSERNDNDEIHKRIL